MIKGIIFDYGGTIDTDSIHWAEVIWKGYQKLNVNVTKELFRMAYVHAERTLAKFPLVKPEHNFLNLMNIKIDIQTSFLVDAGFWKDMEGKEKERKRVSELIANFCYQFVLDNLMVSKPVIKQMADKFPLVLVSNFYGNINTILNDFKLNLFQFVIESAVVGVRKPDPRIFQLGVEKLKIMPNEVIVVGDSYKKDIIPANAIGCKTVWIKGVGWDQKEQPDLTLPDAVINSIKLLPQVVNDIVNNES